MGRVALKDCRLTSLPGRQLEGTIGHDVLWLCPSRPVHLHHVSGHWKGGSDRQEMEKVAGWPFQFDDQGDVVQGVHTYPAWIGYFTSVVRSGALDVVQKVS